MTVTDRKVHYTYEQYVTLEDASTVRHEYLDGEIYAMTGGPPDHAEQQEWRQIEARRGETISLASLSAGLAVDELYKDELEDVSFDPASC